MPPHPLVARGLRIVAAWTPSSSLVSGRDGPQTRHSRPVLGGHTYRRLAKPLRVRVLYRFSEARSGGPVVGSRGREDTGDCGNHRTLLAHDGVWPPPAWANLPCRPCCPPSPTPSSPPPASEFAPSPSPAAASASPDRIVPPSTRRPTRSPGDISKGQTRDTSIYMRMK